MLQSANTKVRKRKAERSVIVGNSSQKPQQAKKVKFKRSPKASVHSPLPIPQKAVASTSSSEGADSDQDSAEAVEPPSLLEGQIFSVLRACGESTYGTVYLVQSNTDHKLYASKVFKTKPTSQMPSSFSGEVKVLKQISRRGFHPNIVHYYGAEITCRLEVRMMIEFCNGGDLHDQTARFRETNMRAPRQFALHAFIQCCESLAWLHHGLRHDGTNGYVVDDNFTEGTIHGDIKPENILLNRERRDIMPRLVICDFSHGSLASQPRSHVGTPMFFSPEARAIYHGKPIPGQPISTKHDCYAMGLTLYSLLWDAYWPVGRHPRSLRVPPEHQDLGLERLLCAMLQPKPSARPDMNDRPGNMLGGILELRALRYEMYEREGLLDKKLWKTV